MGQRSRLVVVFAASLLLAASAQYSLGQGGAMWFIPLGLYSLAIVLFLWVVQQLRFLPQEAAGTQSLSLLLSDARHAFAGPLGRVVMIGVSLMASLVATQESLRPAEQPFDLAIFMWLLSIASLCAAFVPWGRAQGLNWSRLRAWSAGVRPATSLLVGVFGIVLLGFILRAFDVDHIPLNFGGDEGEMGMQARLFMTGQFNDPFSTSWTSQQTMWFYLQSWSLRVFGDDIFGLRMLSVIFGTLCILSTYLLVRELWGNKLAAIAALLLAVYPFHLHFSRLAINNIADPLFNSLVFLLVIRALNTRRTGYFVLAGVALGLSQYGYWGMRLLLITLPIFVGYWLISDHRAILAQFKNLCIMVGAAIVTFAPMAAYYVKSPHMLVEHTDVYNIISSGWLERTMHNTGQSAATILLERSRQAFLMFNVVPDYSQFYGPRTPLLDSISAILFVFGLAYSLYRIRDRAYFLFVAWFTLAIFIGGVMTIDTTESQRIVTTTVPVIVFVTIGLWRVIQVVGRVLLLAPRLRWQLVALGLAVIALININSYFFQYTPKRTYAGDGGWRLSEISRLFLAQPTPFKAYFFGPPYEFIEHGIIRFMVPNLDGMDVQEPVTDFPQFVDHSRKALFVFNPGRAQELKLVQDAYPNGELLDYKKPNGEELFLAYGVDDP